MNKLLTLLVLSVSAPMLIASHSVSAQTNAVYACVAKNGTLSFQDKYCSKRKTAYSKKAHNGTFSNLNIGLRKQEVLMLKQLQERQIAEISSRKKNIIIKPLRPIN